MNTLEPHFDKVTRCMGVLQDRILDAKRHDGPKQTGAVRRASMDLTCALAEMRAGSTRALAEMRAGK